MDVTSSGTSSTGYKVSNVEYKCIIIIQIIIFGVSVKVVSVKFLHNIRYFIISFFYYSLLNEFITQANARLNNQSATRLPPASSSTTTLVSSNTNTSTHTQNTPATIANISVPTTTVKPEVIPTPTVSYPSTVPPTVVASAVPSTTNAASTTLSSSTTPISAVDVLPENTPQSYTLAVQLHEYYQKRKDLRSILHDKATLAQTHTDTRRGVEFVELARRTTEPARRRAHWDAFLEETIWAATDIYQNRRWKIAVAKDLADEAVEYVKQKQLHKKIIKCTSTSSRIADYYQHIQLSSPAKSSRGLLSIPNRAIEHSPNAASAPVPTTTINHPLMSKVRERASMVSDAVNVLLESGSSQIPSTSGTVMERVTWTVLRRATLAATATADTKALQVPWFKKVSDMTYFRPLSDNSSNPHLQLDTSKTSKSGLTTPTSRQLLLVSSAITAAAATWVQDGQQSLSSYITKLEEQNKTSDTLQQNTNDDKFNTNDNYDLKLRWTQETTAQRVVSAWICGAPAVIEGFTTTAGLGRRTVAAACLAASHALTYGTHHVRPAQTFSIVLCSTAHIPRWVSAVYKWCPGMEAITIVTDNNDEDHLISDLFISKSTTNNNNSKSTSKTSKSSTALTTSFDSPKGTHAAIVYIIPAARGHKIIPKLLDVNKKQQLVSIIFDQRGLLQTSHINTLAPLATESTLPGTQSTCLSLQTIMHDLVNACVMNPTYRTSFTNAHRLLVTAENIPFADASYLNDLTRYMFPAAFTAENSVRDWALAAYRRQSARDNTEKEKERQKQRDDNSSESATPSVQMDQDGDLRNDVSNPSATALDATAQLVLAMSEQQIASVICEAVNKAIVLLYVSISRIEGDREKPLLGPSVFGVPVRTDRQIQVPLTQSQIYAQARLVRSHYAAAAHMGAFPEANVIASVASQLGVPLRKVAGTSSSASEDMIHALTAAAGNSSRHPLILSFITALHCASQHSQAMLSTSEIPSRSDAPSILQGSWFQQPLGLFNYLPGQVAVKSSFVTFFPRIVHRLATDSNNEFKNKHLEKEFICFPRVTSSFRNTRLGTDISNHQHEYSRINGSGSIYIANVSITPNKYGSTKEGSYLSVNGTIGTTISSSVITWNRARKTSSHSRTTTVQDTYSKDNMRFSASKHAIYNIIPRRLVMQHTWNWLQFVNIDSVVAVPTNTLAKTHTSTMDRPFILPGSSVTSTIFDIPKDVCPAPRFSIADPYRLLLRSNKLKAVSAILSECTAFGQRPFFLCHNPVTANIIELFLSLSGISVIRLDQQEEIVYSHDPNSMTEEMMGTTGIWSSEAIQRLNTCSRVQTAVVACTATPRWLMALAEVEASGSSGPNSNIAGSVTLSSLYGSSNISSNLVSTAVDSILGPDIDARTVDIVVLVDAPIGTSTITRGPSIISDTVLYRLRAQRPQLVLQFAGTGGFEEIASAVANQGGNKEDILATLIRNIHPSILSSDAYHSLPIPLATTNPHILTAAAKTYVNIVHRRALESSQLTVSKLSQGVSTGTTMLPTLSPLDRRNLSYVSAGLRQRARRTLLSNGSTPRSMPWWYVIPADEGEEAEQEATEAAVFGSVDAITGRHTANRPTGKKARSRRKLAASIRAAIDVLSRHQDAGGTHFSHAYGPPHPDMKLIVAPPALSSDSAANYTARVASIQPVSFLSHDYLLQKKEGLPKHAATAPVRDVPWRTKLPVAAKPTGTTPSAATTPSATLNQNTTIMERIRSLPRITPSAALVGGIPPAMWGSTIPGVQARPINPSVETGVTTSAYAAGMAVLYDGPVSLVSTATNPTATNALVGPDDGSAIRNLHRPSVTSPSTTTITSSTSTTLSSTAASTTTISSGTEITSSASNDMVVDDTKPVAFSTSSVSSSMDVVDTSVTTLVSAPVPLSSVPSGKAFEDYMALPARKKIVDEEEINTYGAIPEQRLRNIAENARNFAIAKKAALAKVAEQAAQSRRRWALIGLYTTTAERAVKRARLALGVPGEEIAAQELLTFARTDAAAVQPRFSDTVANDWTAVEDIVLLRAVAQYGGNWYIVADALRAPTAATLLPPQMHLAVVNRSNSNQPPVVSVPVSLARVRPVRTARQCYERFTRLCSKTIMLQASVPPAINHQGQIIGNWQKVTIRSYPVNTALQRKNRFQSSALGVGLYSTSLPPPERAIAMRTHGGFSSSSNVPSHSAASSLAMRTISSGDVNLDAPVKLRAVARLVGTSNANGADGTLSHAASQTKASAIQTKLSTSVVSTLPDPGAMIVHASQRPYLPTLTEAITIDSQTATNATDPARARTLADPTTNLPLAEFLLRSPSAYAASMTVPAAAAQAARALGLPGETNTPGTPSMFATLYQPRADPYRPRSPWVTSVKANVQAAAALQQASLQQSNRNVQRTGSNTSRTNSSSSTTTISSNPTDPAISKTSGGVSNSHVYPPVDLTDKEAVERAFATIASNHLMRIAVVVQKTESQMMAWLQTELSIEEKAQVVAIYTDPALANSIDKRDAAVAEVLAPKLEK